MTATAQPEAQFPSRRREYGLDFVTRVYPGRIVGLALGGIAVAGVFWSEGAGWVMWALLWASALAWPHFAHGLAINSAHPYEMERRCMMVDSALGGVFIALMKFNLLPSALFVTMLSMDKLSVGGMRFFVPCSAALLGACTATAAINGFAVRLETSLLEIYASLPLLVAYPLAVGYTSYRMARQLRFQNKQLQAMNARGGLAQMPKRVAWEKAVAEEFELSRSVGSASAILLIDIDDLEGINDRYGHPVGDEVVRSVAATLRNALREHDLPGRYGGKEFAALLPGADARRAVRIGERVRKAVGASIVEATAQVVGTVSIGVAASDPGDRRYGDWVGRAEEALAAARAKGGNRTELGVAG